MSRYELSFVNSFLAAQILTRNGQRPGVIQNMTIQEYEALEPVGKDYSVLIIFKWIEFKLQMC